ncbi:MAG: response regulator transcription factor [Alphaproteobacteria bacterium]|nr:response regulator transcription factor [Alphaproteobacteria bacterium]
MNKTILIIDDDDMLRTSLAKGLRSNGFDAVTAESAEAAGEILERISADAIVLDRMMGGMDGLGFLKKLRESGDRTPVIMLTALSGAENAIAGLSCGADDYLAKPFQLRELVLRLQNMLKSAHSERQDLPPGLAFSDNEFYINGKMLSLSGGEKNFLRILTSPVGNIAPAAPMVAKRLREKLALHLSAIDLITVRGKGYKLVKK